MSRIRAPRHDTADRPFIVIWEATQACPLACLHCRAEARPDRHWGELTEDEARSLMRQVKELGTPPPIFVITGGDPFQRPDLYSLVRYAAEIGLPIAVSPSGTPTLNRDSLTRLRDAGARALSLSLDGATARVHDAFRATPHVYDWTVDAWRNARELGLRVQINTTVTGHNLDDLPEIVRLVHELGATTWSAFLLVPTGRGRLLPPLSPHQVEDVLNFVYDAGAFVPARTTEAHHFRRVVIQREILDREGTDHVRALELGPLYTRLREQLNALDLPRRRSRRAPMDVNAARGFVFVSHLGSVQPSGFLPLSAGNVRDEELGEIYRSSPLFTGLRDPGRLTGRCGKCEFASLCGGSRSRAFALSGDPYAEDPWCPYRPASFGHVAEVAAAQIPGPRPAR